MTPREQETLAMILRHVATHNRRAIVAVKARPLLLSAGITPCGLVVKPEGVAIDGVVFAPDHRESA